MFIIAPPTQTVCVSVTAAELKVIIAFGFTVISLPLSFAEMETGLSEATRIL